MTYLRQNVLDKIIASATNALSDASGMLGGGAAYMSGDAQAAPSQSISWPLVPATHWGR